MRRLCGLLLLAVLVPAAGLWQAGWSVPARWAPWRALELSNQPTPVTRWKLARLADQPEACRAALSGAPDGVVRFTPLARHERAPGCPLSNVVHVERAGVGFNRGFVATCPLVAAWTIYVRHRLQPAAKTHFGVPVTEVRHFGSFACRNVYGREDGRRSDHATANALDVAGFRLADGRRVSVRDDWGGDGEKGAFLEEAFHGACELFGTVLGPEYNAAHANHFHLGMRGFGLCH